jgi:hypothetical protein
MTRATLATLLLTLGLLAGCGEDEPPPRAADDGDGFCSLYIEQMKSQLDLDDANVEEKVRSAREWADRMRDADLPDDLPAEARRGLERMIETLGELDADATAEELESLGDDFGKQAREEVDAMGGYVLEKCAAEIDEVMSGQLDGLQDQLDGMTESP